MSFSNPFIKPLTAFDPKKNLEVNENFRQMIEASSGDTISELMADLPGEESSSQSGKDEIKPFKTSASIIAGLESVPGSGENLVLAANKKGSIYLFSAQGGTFSPIWTKDFPGTFIKKPVVSEKMGYFILKEGGVVAMDLGIKEAGKASPPRVVWSKKLNKGILSEPILTKKMLLVTALSGLYAFDAYDAEKSKGKLLWQKAIGGIASTPAYGSGLIILGNESKKIFALRDKGDDVSLLWKAETDASVRMKLLLTQLGQFVVAASIGGTVYFMDRNNGKIIWIFAAQSPIFSNIVSVVTNNNEYFFFGADNGIFYCINAGGQEKWRFKTNGKIRGEALIHGSTIYFGSYDNHLYALDLETGKQKFKYATEGYIEGKPIIINNSLYFGSGDSFLYNLHS